MLALQQFMSNGRQALLASPKLSFRRCEVSLGVMKVLLGCRQILSQVYILSPCPFVRSTGEDAVDLVRRAVCARRRTATLGLLLAA